MIKNIIIVVLLSSVSVGGYIADRTIDGLKATITMMHLKHKKQTLRRKAKARFRRVLGAIPLVGAAAFVYFEKTEFDEWKEDNPDGTAEQYKDEIANSYHDWGSEIASNYCKEHPDFDACTE